MRFNNVIGQQDLKTHLTEIIDNNRVANTTLFVGKDGYGTLPIALAYAQLVLCTNSNENHNACMVKTDHFNHPDMHFCYPVSASAKSDSKPTSGHYLKDWVELNKEQHYFSIDDWSNHINIGNKQPIINVHQSAEILQSLSLKPYESDYRIMVIWKPERMNIQAANKLLKIIEEPPEKTMFVLVSEDAEQLLPTIVSRCQLIKVPKINEQDLAKQLATELAITESEAVNQFRFVNGDYIEAKLHIRQDTNLVLFREHFIAWMRICYTRDIAKINKWVNDVAKLGREKQKAFLDYSLHLLRNCLLQNASLESILLVDKDESEFIQKFSRVLSPEIIQRIMEEIDESSVEIARNVYAKLVFLDMSLSIIKAFRLK